jgi:hypothetical protein
MSSSGRTRSFSTRAGLLATEEIEDVVLTMMEQR